MSKKYFLQELYSNPWAISFPAIETLRAAALQNIEMLSEDHEPLSITGIHPSGNVSASHSPGEEFDVFRDFPEGSVVVLPLIGIMTKYWSWWTWGVDNIAELIRAADLSSKISGMVILINTPGGDVTSVFQISDAIKNATKPVYALVDGGCYSAGEYVRGFCTKSYALHEMCGFGSIGIVATFRDYKKMEEEFGIKTVVIYPPESKFKNLPERQALDGKPDLIIKEQLTPWAVHFQETMRTNLPAMDDTVVGILEGKEFYAADAVKFGWIDGITNLEGVISEITKEINTRKTIL